MDNLNKKLKTLSRFDMFFIIVGILEVFLLVLITHKLYLMIIGVITIIPAYMALKESNLKWNYFVGIWALVKYNPLTGTAMVAFILAKIFSGFGGGTLSTIFMFLTIALVVIVAISSLVVGIIIIVKTAKYIKLKKGESNLINS